MRLTSAISFFTVGSHLGFFDWPDCCDDAWFRSVELEVLISGGKYQLNAPEGRGKINLSTDIDGLCGGVKFQSRFL